MEVEHYHDLFYFKTIGKKPQHLVGKKNKSKWRAFKKTATLYEVHPKKKFMEIPRSLLDMSKGNLFRLQKKKKGLLKGKIWKIVVKKSEIEELWNHFHSSPEFGGHRGLWAMYNAISRIYYIPHMKAYIQELLRECQVCRETKVNPEAPPIVAIVPSEPMMVWQADYIGPFPADVKTGHMYALNIIDCFSKKLWSFTTEKQSDQHFIASIEKAKEECNGYPKRIHTDNGGPFISSGMKLNIFFNYLIKLIILIILT